MAQLLPALEARKSHAAGIGQFDLAQPLRDTDGVTVDRVDDVVVHVRVVAASSVEEVAFESADGNPQNRCTICTGSVDCIIGSHC